MGAPGTDVDLPRLHEICERYGVATLEVFGSAARGEARDGSDLDILYTLRPGARLGWKIEQLSDELAELFDPPVDLAFRLSLHPRLRNDVIAEARPRYAAA